MALYGVAYRLVRSRHILDRNRFIVCLSGSWPGWIYQVRVSKSEDRGGEKLHMRKRSRMSGIRVITCFLQISPGIVYCSIVRIPTYV